MRPDWDFRLARTIALTFAALGFGYIALIALLHHLA